MARQKIKHPYSSYIHRRAILRLFAIGLLIYLIAAGLSGLKLIVSAISSADLVPLLLAGCAVALSFACAAGTYILLSPRRLPVVPTFLVQVATGLVNRLLPSGLGGLGLNAFYLKKRGYSLASSTVIVAANNTVGFIGNLLLLMIIGVFLPFSIPDLRFPGIPISVYAALIVAGLAAAWLIRRSRTLSVELVHIFHEMQTYIRAAAGQPLRTSAALLCSSTLTALHALAMYLVLLSVGAEIDWPVALLAISLGALAGALIPTPGGIGGAEAGIAAALIAFSIPAPVAVTAALLYRGLTYWTPLLPGYFAFQVVERRYL